MRTCPKCGSEAPPQATACGTCTRPLPPITWPAGWYDDPWGQFPRRYHDGVNWTQHGTGSSDHRGADAPGVGTPEAERPPDHAPAGEGSSEAAADVHLGPGSPPLRRRPRLVVTAAVLLALVVVAGGFAVGLFGGASPTSTTGSEDALAWNDLLARQCGVPGHGEYHAQARCIITAVGPAGPTDDRGLATIYRDACNSPSIPADELPHRIADVTSTEALVQMMLTVRLARIHCGAGQSLDYDGFRDDFEPPSVAADHSGTASSAHRQYLDLLLRSHPPASSTPEPDLIEIGETACDSLAAGMPLGLLIERGAQGSSREFMMAMVTAANTALCPEVVPVG